MPGSYDIGPRIGIDGEKEFRAALSSMGQQLRTLGTEMRAVTSAFDTNDKSQENLAQQSDVLTRQLELQEKRLEEIQKALDYARENYAENSNQVQRWQQAMNNATADLNRTRQQLARVQSEMDSAADSTEDLADGMDEAGDAADESSGKFSAATVAIGNLAANAISAAVSAIGDLIGSLVNLDESTEEYRIAQGRLNTAFESAGYGADTAQQAYRAFYGILGDTDTATEASQLLAQLAEREEDVATWTDIAAGVSGTFGDSLPIEGLIEAANETANVGQVTGVLADALNWVGISEDEFNAKLAECTTESERNRLIMDTLSGTYDEASDAFYRNNEALVQSRNNQALLNETTAMLGQTVSDIKNRLLSEFLPAISNVATAFNGMLTGQGGSSEAFAQSIQELISTVAANLPGFLDAGVQIVTSLVSGILQSIPSLVSAVPELLSSFVSTLAAGLPDILQAGAELLNQLTTGIENGLPDMIARIPVIIENFLNYITENLPRILDQGVVMLNQLVNGILSAIPDLVDALPEIITSLIKFVADNLPEIVAAGVDILGNLIAGIISAIPQLIAALPEIISAIVNGLADLGGAIVEAGKEIIRGLWEGISDMAGWIGEKIRGFGEGVLQGIKDFFGIASPSKLFENEVGRYMAQGIGVGFEDEMRSVSANMQRSIPTPTIDTINNAAAGMVNGMQTAMTGGVGAQPATIILQLGNGRELARWLVPDIRAVERSDPEVVSGV